MCGAGSGLCLTVDGADASELAVSDVCDVELDVCVG